ncbi:TPA: glycosyltransferase [Kluyvera georgiana]|nr:glycosyltransferase [Kluyvera georgiana]
MKNVAFIITKSEVGGAQTWVNEMAKVLSGDCNLFLITAEHGWLTEDPECFLDVYVLPDIKKYCSIITLIRLIYYLKKNNIQTLVASSANAGIYARLAKLFHAHKCIYVSHGWSCIYNGGRLQKIFCGVEKYLSKITDIIWCISECDKKKAIDIIGVDNNKIVMIPNSVTPMQKRTHNDNKFRILFVGRLTHPKRPELLANVISKKQHCRLDVIGGGEQLESLRNKFKNFDNINFLGEISNFSDYHCYDLFVLISDSEGLPMSGLEAHTAGLPLLLSNVGGCFELIDGNGLLTNNDEVTISDNIDFIFSKYDEFSSVALNASEKYAIDNYIQKYKNIILG